jgi:hypothetical protein
MPTEDDTRTVEQEIATGQSARTPVALISSVAGVIAVVVALAIGLAALAYFFA